FLRMKKERQLNIHWTSQLNRLTQKLSIRQWMKSSPKTLLSQQEGVSSLKKVLASSKTLLRKLSLIKKTNRSVIKPLICFFSRDTDLRKGGGDRSLNIYR